MLSSRDDRCLIDSFADQMSSTVPFHLRDVTKTFANALALEAEVTKRLENAVINTNRSIRFTMIEKHMKRKKFPKGNIMMSLLKQAF